MEFSQYVRKPFVVEAVEITEDNIADLAKFIGQLKTKDDGTPYILVDRRLVPNVFRVYPGFFMTQMDDRIRCYTRKVFKEQFCEANENVLAWVNFMNGSDEHTPA